MLPGLHSLISNAGIHQHDRTRAELGDGGGPELRVREDGRVQGLPRHDDQGGEAPPRHNRHQEPV